MKTKSIFLIGGGLVMIFLGLTLLPVRSVLHIGLPLVIGVFFLLFGLNPNFLRFSKRDLIFLQALYFPIISGWLLFLNEFLEGDRNRYSAFWYSSGGVCTEGTFCWIWGMAVPFLFIIVMFVVSGIRTRRLRRMEQEFTQVPPVVDNAPRASEQTSN